MPGKERWPPIPDSVIAVFVVTLLWIGNCSKFESGTSPTEPTLLQIPAWSLLAWVTLKMGKWFVRKR